MFGLNLGAPINKAKLAKFRRQAMQVHETSMSTVSKKEMKPRNYVVNVIKCRSKSRISNSQLLYCLSLGSIVFSWHSVNMYIHGEYHKIVLKLDALYFHFHFLWIFLLRSNHSHILYVFKFWNCLGIQILLGWILCTISWLYLSDCIMVNLVQFWPYYQKHCHHIQEVANMYKNRRNSTFN